MYSEIERMPSPLSVRNNDRANAPTPPPFNFRNSNHPAVAEPIYNELENSGVESTENGTSPYLLTRKANTPPVAEPIYNELENSGTQNEVTNLADNELDV